MDMEEEMEEIFAKDDPNFFVIDFEYEFDADHFFDFTRPESSYEAAVSESWFRTACTYPPSPFAVKSKWREEMYGEKANASFKSNVCESMTCNIKNSDDLNPDVQELNGNTEGKKCNHEFPPSTPTAKTKSVVKSSGIRSSTLMKPTASQLAKLKPANEIYPCRSLGRSPTPQTASSDTSSRTSPLSVYVDATKRQKLECGYLYKVARLKHQNLLLHKLSKVPRVFANNVNSRPKPTIPKEPDLETTQRAQRHRFRNNPETDVNRKLEPSASKILKTYPLPPQNKSGQRSPLSQRPYIQDSESIDCLTGIDKLNSEDSSKQDKHEPANRTKVRPLSKQKLKHRVENRSSCNPPTELFKKMSLKSDVEHGATCRSKQQLNKISKENVPDSFRREMLVS